MMEGDPGPLATEALSDDLNNPMTPNPYGTTGDQFMDRLSDQPGTGQQFMDRVSDREATGAQFMDRVSDRPTTGAQFMDRLSDQPLSDRPKAQLERFEAVGEMDFDKVARPPGDPFEYAMKGGKIFVRDTRKNEGFRDVSGIQNEAAIRSVIEKFGKTAEPYAKRSGGGTMDMRELTGVEDRPPLEEERILGTKR